MHKFNIVNYIPIESPKEGYLLHFEIIDNQATLFFHSDMNFSVTLPFYPSFLIESMNAEGCENFLKKQFDIKNIEMVKKIDLSEFNHLCLPNKNLLKVYFVNQNSFTNAKNKIKNILKKKEDQTFNQFSFNVKDIPLFSDIMEHDIPFDNLFLIENNLRVGKWYHVEDNKIKPSERLTLPSLKVFAFDIETTKEPLLFPDSKTDQIMMISILADTGHLIVNREIVKEDIKEFTYQPKPDIGSNFTIYNENNEKELLIKFYELIYIYQPEIFTTYNGDSFDIPFIIERSKYNQMTEFTHIFSKTIVDAVNSKSASSKEEEEISILKIIHLDSYKWVKRDSYLPMGSQGLKNVTQVKLNYFPDELDPESLIILAKENPQILASYSVSDSVACHAIYTRFVNLFIFSLCTLIPLNSLDVLEKGSGTLCEALLIAQAYEKQVLIPDKNKAVKINYPHVVNNLNYVGGHVECIRSGIYRHDFDYEFKVDKKYLIDLIKRINLSQDIIHEIEELGEEDILSIKSKPYIYHLDVGAMYPNIILTNKLQPVAVKSDEDCLRCDFYAERDKCQRKLKWTQRIEYFPPTKREVTFIKKQLQNEEFISEEKKKNVSYKYLPNKQKEQIFMKRLKQFSRDNYKKLHIVKEEEKTSIICQREVPFYLETVQRFRDQRIKYKNLSKIDKANSKIYDSLQIAHKVVLNSFYGYVMRKGSRWYSLEMAAVTCYQGAEIIKVAKDFIERIGLVLELDTDGIWCLVPNVLPINYGKENILKIIINFLIKEKFSNEQFYISEKNKSEETYNSIEFEIDGPYNAMVLPSSTEENKLIKKKYLIINKNNKISELKGFEIKRRGELNFIKKFQDDLFNKFMLGSSLKECYNILGDVCEYWLSIITQKASFLSEEDVFSFFTESKSMSKEIEEYDNQNILNASVAKRLSEFLGHKILKNGLKCEYIICNTKGSIANKAVPIQIFQCEPNKRDFYLNKWIKQTGNIKDIIDWEYYRSRISNVILKIVVLPAIYQNIGNPVKGIELPKWSIKCNNLDNFLQKNNHIYDNITSQRNNIIINAAEVNNIINYSELTLNELVKIRKDYWINSFEHSFKCKLKDPLIISQENNKINVTSLLNNKLINEEISFINDYLLELFDNESHNELVTYKLSGNPVNVIEVKEINSKLNNEFINHLAVKNIYYKDVPLIYKVNNIYKRIGNDFNYFIVSSFKYEKRIFYIISVFNSTKINDYNEFMHKHSINRDNNTNNNINNDNDNLVFVSSKYLNYKVLNINSLKYLRDTHLAIYTDNTSKTILNEFISVFMKEKIIYSLGDVQEMIKECKEVHSNMHKKIERENIISKSTNVHLLGVNDLDYLFYNYLLNNKLLLNNKREYYNIFNNTYSMEGYYNYSIMIKLKNTLIYSLLEENDDIFYSFIKLLFDKRDPFYLNKVEEWIKYKSKIIPHNLRNKLLVNQQKYIINQIKLLNELKIQSIFINKNIIIINTNKRERNNEFKEYLRNILEVEIIREYDKIVIFNEYNYIFKIDDTIRAYGDSYIPEEIAIKYFNDENISNEMIYKLIIKDNVKYNTIKYLIQMIKLKRNKETNLSHELTNDISVLESNCYKLLKLSLFRNEEGCYKVNIFCKCKNDNVIFTDGTNKVFCNYCYHQLSSESLDNALIEQIENELREYLENEVTCINCNENKRRLLQSICKCGYVFKHKEFIINDKLFRTDEGRRSIRELINGLKSI